jgi:hypothetical protein
MAPKHQQTCHASRKSTELQAWLLTPPHLKLYRLHIFIIYDKMAFHPTQLQAWLLTPPHLKLYHHHIFITYDKMACHL